MAFYYDFATFAVGTLEDGPADGTFARLFDPTHALTPAKGASTADLAMAQGQWTIEAYVRTTAIGSNQCVFSIAGDTSSDASAISNIQMSLGINTTGKIRTIWEHLSGTNDDFASSGTSLSANTWHHVAVVKNATHVRFYLDGVFLDQVAWSNTSTGGSSAGWCIGCNGTQASPIEKWTGRIREIRISNIARSDAEIAASHATMTTTARHEIDEDTYSIWRLGSDDDLLFTVEDTPTIDNFVPADFLIREETIIEFDVIGNLAYTGLLVVYPDDTQEVVFDGFEFGEHYQTDVNDREETETGYHFTLRRDDGWKQSPSFKPAMLDMFGNIAAVA